MGELTTSTRPRLAAVPGLDELAEDPSVANGLPREVLLELNARAVTALAALSGPLLAAASGQQERPRDRLLDVDSAAERLGCSADWLYRNARKLPFTVQKGKGAKLRFSSEGIDRYIRESQRA